MGYRLWALGFRTLEVFLAEAQRRRGAEISNIGKLLEYETIFPFFFTKLTRCYSGPSSNESAWTLGR